MQLETILLTMGVPSAITGLCFWWVQQSMKRCEKKREERDKAKEANEFLLLRSVAAAITLGEATAKAIKDGKTNGEMTEALSYAQEIKRKQKDFMIEQGIKHLY